MSQSHLKKSQNVPPDDEGAEIASNDLTENLYKKNIELLTKNKTLLLLSKLYEISILALEPKDLAQRVSQTIQADLSLELVGIFAFDAKLNSLASLAFSKSDRIVTSLKKQQLVIENINVSNVASQEFFKEVLAQNKTNMTDSFEEVWSGLIDQRKLQAIASESHIKATLLFPLTVEGKVLGAIMFSLNREYVSLSSFEQESLKSLVNVIAVALEKANLYQQLQSANRKLRELDRQKDAVLHMVAHQFKGPVTTINFVAELLLDGTYGQLTEEQKKSVTTIQKASQKMGSQSEMVLDAAKITVGKLPLDPQLIDLNGLLKEVVDEAENNAKQKNVRLEVSLLASHYPSILLDKKYTQLAIDNLLSNAIKYTALKSEGGSVYFKTEIKNSTLFIMVQDTGIGIPKDEQENIFMELFRASNAGKDGNGLGLHVAKGAIEGQGGKMWFISEEGKGTTFFIELPLKEPKAKNTVE